MPRATLHAVVALLGLVLLCASEGHACDCGPSGPFMDVSRYADLVATVTVAAYGPALPKKNDRYAYMEVSVLEVLRGDEDQKSVRVYGDTGFYCRPNVTPTTFPLGATFVVAIDRVNGASEYSISNCGAHWLLLERGAVSGHIRSTKHKSMRYDSLRKLFAARPAKP